MAILEDFNKIVICTIKNHWTKSSRKNNASRFDSTCEWPISSYGLKDRHISSLSRGSRQPKWGFLLTPSAEVFMMKRAGLAVFWLQTWLGFTLCTPGKAVPPPWPSSTVSKGEAQSASFAFRVVFTCPWPQPLYCHWTETHKTFSLSF